ncbi:MAG: hypothetical protein GWO81_03200 [Verrucomicrobia bacterium]|nr:hypothetical protein [Verrucomicrobiota bacterium]
MKAKRIFSLLSSTLALFLSGCSVAILNTTPETLPRSASGLYTLSARVALTDSLVNRTSLETFVVIDGETHRMMPHPDGGGFYEYVYSLPASRSQTRYYFEMQYQLHKDNTPDKNQKAQTSLNTLRIVAPNPTSSASHNNILRVIPSSIDLRSGQRQALVFELTQPAPSGGFPILVTTDIPQSIIMPKVFIPAGARTASISVQGDRPGAGKLFIQATSQKEIVIPVRVR